MNAESAIHKLAIDWASDKDVQAAGEALIRYLFSEKSGQLHLSFRRLIEISNSSPGVTFRLAQYLTGDALPLLKQRFELILDDEVWELEDHQVHFAAVHGQLMHPDTGTPVPHYKEHVFPFYEKGDGLVD